MRATSATVLERSSAVGVLRPSDSPLGLDELNCKAHRVAVRRMTAARSPKAESAVEYRARQVCAAAAVPMRGMEELYPPISQLGVVGDRRTAGVISADGTVRWLCLPNYDGVRYSAA
jgi:hypothetical protein